MARRPVCKHPAFEPTPLDRAIVKTCKAAGVREEIIRTLILNPHENNKPVSKATFAKHFAPEISTAKAQLNAQALSVFFTGLQNPDFDIRFKCANKVLQLCSKGVFEDKFELDNTKSAQDQINQITDALRSRRINNYEADTFIKAVEAKVKTADETEARTGIIIVVDQATDEIMEKSVQVQPGEDDQ